MAALLPLAAGAFVTYPLLRFLLLPWAPALGPAFAPPPGDGPGLGLAALNTIRLATLSAGCALVPALWLGLMLERRSWRGRRALAATLLLLFLLPGYLVAAGWQILLGSTALRSAAWLRDVLLGWPGLVGLTALKGLPVATLVARAGWAARRPGLEEATLLHVRGRGRRALLSARPILPFAAAAFLIVFVEATQDYGLAATLGARLRLPLLVSEVYASLANWPISWTRAARAGDLLVLIALLPAGIRFLLPRSAPPLLDRGRVPPPRPASPWEAWLGWGATALLLGLGCGVPLLALAADAASPEAGGLPDGAFHALLASLLYGFVASLTALCLACMLAAEGGGSRLRGALAWLPMANMAVPGIVLGAAEVIAFNGPPLPLTGTPLALLLGQTATQLPLLALFMRAPIRARSAAYGDAARVHGIRLADRIEWIYLPPLLRPLAWAWSLAFCRLVFELPLAQMLAPAGGEPVGVALVQLQQSLRFAAEARLALLAMLMCGAVVGGVLLLAGRGR
jgi:iron(III) transport system permease protein